MGGLTGTRVGLLAASRWGGGWCAPDWPPGTNFASHAGLCDLVMLEPGDDQEMAKG